MRGAFHRRVTMLPSFVGVLYVPYGLSTGFVTVTLGYVLAQHGVGVATIAGLVGLKLLPDTWCFLAGPLIDSCWTSTRWYLFAAVIIAVCTVGFAFVPLQESSALVFGALCLSSGIAGVLSSSAASATLALTTSNEVRGACAGWRQTGYLGGQGLGGGAGLWLATHAGGLPVAAWVSAAVCVSCAWPYLIVQVPPAARGAGAVAAAREAIGALWRLLRDRAGILAIVAVTLPTGLGAAANLLPSVASDWQVSADVVAAVTGLLGGLSSIPGCLTAGYLCDRYARRTVFVVSALIAALGEAVMALAPHVPWAFAALVLVNAALTGLAYGSVTAVIYERLRPVGAATVYGVLGSLCSLPVVVVTMLIGFVQSRHGSTAMLLTEAGLGVVSVAIYAVLVMLWRPDSSLAGDAEMSPEFA